MKTTTFKFRISIDDLQMIKAKAAASGIPAAEFIRLCCEEREVAGYVPTASDPIAGIAGQLSFDGIEMDVRE